MQIHSCSQGFPEGNRPIHSTYIHLLCINCFLRRSSNVFFQESELLSLWEAATDLLWWTQDVPEKPIYRCTQKPSDLLWHVQKDDPTWERSRLLNTFTKEVAALQDAVTLDKWQQGTWRSFPWGVFCTHTAPDPWLLPHYRGAVRWACPGSPGSTVRVGIFLACPEPQCPHL